MHREATPHRLLLGKHVWLMYLPVENMESQWVEPNISIQFAPLVHSLWLHMRFRRPQKLRLSTHVNGELLQLPSTSDMILDVAELNRNCHKTRSCSKTPWFALRHNFFWLIVKDSDYSLLLQGVGRICHVATEISKTRRFCAHWDRKSWHFQESCNGRSTYVMHQKI